MNPIQQHYLSLTRRRFFGTAAAGLGAGLGALALGDVLGERAYAQGGGAPLGPLRRRYWRVGGNYHADRCAAKCHAGDNLSAADCPGVGVRRC